MANIVDLIKYEGDNSVFVWKHPCEDFNSLTQLIVHETQEAVFFMNGQALDLFPAGRYTLETENLPQLGKYIGREVRSKTSPFHCEVYFVNKTEQMAIKWGTDTQVQYIEPTYGFPLSIGASGEMTLRAADSRKLLLKLVGTEGELTQKKLVGMFRAFLMTRVKSYIAQIMRTNSISIFEIDEHLVMFSEALKSMLVGDFAEYGLELTQFFVTTVVKPDGERQYERFKDLHFRQYADIAEAKLLQQVSIIEQQTAAQRMVIESQALAQKRAQEGYTYQQERGFDVAEQIAQNESVGQFTNMGMGLGTAAGVGGAVAGLVGGVVSDTMGSVTQSAAHKCTKCGMDLPAGAKFCLSCGEKVVQANENEMVCPVCGKMTPKGKFCMECGAVLERKCPNCGADLPANGKFCLECGTKLQ